MKRCLYLASWLLGMAFVGIVILVTETFNLGYKEERYPFEI